MIEHTPGSVRIPYCRICGEDARGLLQGTQICAECARDFRERPTLSEWLLRQLPTLRPTVTKLLLPAITALRSDVRR